MNGANNTRDVMKEARLIAFLIWYDSRSRSDFTESDRSDVREVVDKVDSGLPVTNGQLAKLQSIQNRVMGEREFEDITNSHEFWP